eukprot:SAG22_NODE_1261_length_4977_cov_9.689832_6_plen_110_part_00
MQRTLSFHTIADGAHFGLGILAIIFWCAIAASCASCIACSCMVAAGDLDGDCPSAAGTVAGGHFHLGGGVQAEERTIDTTRGIHMDSVKLICIQLNICESTLVLSAKEV